MILIVYQTIKTKIIQAFQDHSDIVRKKLQLVLTYIHLSIDIWTSPNQKLLLGITADFVDCKKERYVKALLVLRPVEGHSGQAQYDVLIPVLQEYSIIRKLRAIVGDNSTTNNTLTQVI